MIKVLKIIGVATLFNRTGIGTCFRSEASKSFDSVTSPTGHRGNDPATNTDPLRSQSPDRRSRKPLRDRLRGHSGGEVQSAYFGASDDNNNKDDIVLRSVMAHSRGSRPHSTPGQTPLLPSTARGEAGPHHQPNIGKGPVMLYSTKPIPTVKVL